MTIRPRHCDDEFGAVILGTGSTHAVLGPDEDRGRHVGALLLPDPEERRGWRAWYVYPEPSEARRTPLGFRRP